MYKNRCLLKPGLSGWAQVNYNYAASMEESKISLAVINYLKNFLFIGYFDII